MNGPYASNLNLPSVMGVTICFILLLMARGICKTLSNIYDENFFRKKLTAINYFRRKPPTEIFDKVLDVHLMAVISDILFCKIFVLNRFGNHNLNFIYKNSRGVLKTSCSEFSCEMNWKTLKRLTIRMRSEEKTRYLHWSFPIVSNSYLDKSLSLAWQ